MSPLGKALLASALTLPLVAFVAGVLAAPDPVDPDRSRPVIIGRVSDDPPTDDRAPARSEREDRQGVKRQGPGDDEGDDDGGGAVDGAGDDDDGSPDVTDDHPYTVVTPPPRDLDEDDDDGDDDDDDDSDDPGGDDD